MPERLSRTTAAVILLAAAGILGSCTADDGPDIVVPVEIPAASMSYIVLAWNDQGMPFFSPSYDEEVLLPPYNTLWAQVIKRGDPPEIVTSGVTLEYRIIDNTFSYGKGTVLPYRSYARFWDDSFDLFGVSLAPDTGLNFVDPGVHNGLSGTMLLKSGHFQADGVPVVPINDAGTWDPYQVAEIVVRDSSSGTELARTRTTVPTSDEVRCARCHGQRVSGIDILSVLAEHDEAEGTTFVYEGVPVLCADCHGSPALGQTGPGSSERYLSEVLHSSHSASITNCYNCHPGEITEFHRSAAHVGTENGNCAACHGTSDAIASSIQSGRVPWAGLPKCADCHTFVAEVDTGSALYRAGTAHNGLSCAACHGTAHAQIPSNKLADHYQFLQYQAKALPLGSCRVCHETSKGGGLAGVSIAHGGSQPTSCSVCHTGPITTNNPTGFPHRFQVRVR